MSDRDSTVFGHHDQQDADDRARALLRELAVDAGGVGTFDWDLVTGRLRWDARLITLFGYDADSFDESIEAFNARLHPDDLPRVTTDLEQAIASAGVFDSEYRLVLPDAQVRWVGARGQTLTDTDGRVVRLLGAAYDITDRRVAEVSVASLIESMSTAFFALDTGWRFTYVNTEATALLGRSREQMVGGSIWELFPAAVGSEFETQYRAAMDTDTPVTFEAYYPPPLDAWYEVRAWRNDAGLAVYFLDITARRRLADHADRAADRAELLSRITDQLVATLDHATAAERLATLVVPSLADWCVVSLVDDDQTTGGRVHLSNIGARHRDPDLQPLVEQYARSRLDQMTDHSLFDDALSTGLPQHLRPGATGTVSEMFEPGPVRELIGMLGLDSVLVLPLGGPHGSVGILSLVNTPARGDFTDEDLVTARHVAARAGLVLDNARLYRQQRDVAEVLQRSLLTAPAEPDHVEIAVRYLPAAQAAAVGGDWYDAFVQPAGATVVAVGDVTGHNTAAAAVMGQLRSLLRGIAVYSGAGPAEILRGVDEAMTTLQIGTTATAVVARLEQTPDEVARGVTRIRWSNAGHLPPVVAHPDGTVTVLDGPVPELLLGVRPGTARTEHESLLARGATVLLYTDGLVERRDESLEDGLQRLQAALQQLTAERLSLDELCDRLLAAVLPQQPDDDIALVAVRLHPQELPRPDEAGPNDVPPNVPDPVDATKGS